MNEARLRILRAVAAGRHTVAGIAGAAAVTTNTARIRGHELVDLGYLTVKRIKVVQPGWAGRTPALHFELTDEGKAALE